MSGAKSGMCMTSVVDISIGCGGCNSRYHLPRVCLGLPDSIDNTIKEYVGMGLKFSCTSCRLEEESGNNTPQSDHVVNGSRGLEFWMVLLLSNE